MSDTPSQSMPRAMLLMGASAVSFGLMALLIRMASAQAHAFEIAFFRNLFGLLFVLPLLRGRGLRLLRTDRFWFYVLRCVIGLGAMLTSFWALVNLPLTQAIAISYSTPLWVTIGAALVLGETVRARRWSAVFIGFVGVLVVLRPGGSHLSADALVAVISAALAGSAYISVKFLTRTEHPDAVVIWMGIIMTPLSLVPAMTVWRWPDLHTLGWLLLIGLFGTIGQVCMARAYRLGDISALIPLNFLQLPLVAAIAWPLFGERVGWSTLLGAAIIIAANVYIARREAILGRRQVTDPRASGMATR